MANEFEQELYRLLAKLEASEPDMQTCLAHYNAIWEKVASQLNQMSTQEQSEVLPTWIHLLEQAMNALVDARADLQTAMNQIKGQKRVQSAYLKSP